MVLVTFYVNDSTLSKVDTEVNNSGISWSEIGAKAIDSFVEDVNQSESNDGDAPSCKQVGMRGAIAWSWY